MVIKVKVSDIAKELGKQNKEVIEILSKYCEGPAKKANTVLEENELNILFDKITQDNSVSSFDAYFAAPSKKDAKQKTKKAEDKKSEKDKAKNKKHESQAAILQMAEQAAKRAEEKAKKKPNQTPQARTKGEARHVDTRVNTVNL